MAHVHVQLQGPNLSGVVWDAGYVICRNSIRARLACGRPIGAADRPLLRGMYEEAERREVDAHEGSVGSVLGGEHRVIKERFGLVGVMVRRASDGLQRAITYEGCDIGPIRIEIGVLADADCELLEIREARGHLLPPRLDLINKPEEPLLGVKLGPYRSRCRQHRRVHLRRGVGLVWWGGAQ